jgi:hypothetical protein
MVAPACVAYRVELNDVAGIRAGHHGDGLRRERECAFADLQLELKDRSARPTGRCCAETGERARYQCEECAERDVPPHGHASFAIEQTPKPHVDARAASMSAIGPSF